VLFPNSINYEGFLGKRSHQITESVFTSACTRIYFDNTTIRPSHTNDFTNAGVILAEALAEKVQKGIAIYDPETANF
jgi:hypothetical protein